MPTKPNANSTPALRRLARACGIELSYESSYTGSTLHATDESLLLAIRSWGIDIASPADAAAALGDLLAGRARRRVEPVTAAWLGRKQPLLLRLPNKRDGSPRTSGSAEFFLSLSSGAQQSWRQRVADRPIRARRQPDGSTAHFAEFDLRDAPGSLTAGYHRLAVTHAGESFESLVIAAPVVSYQPEGFDHLFGLFSPTYALRSSDNLGVGNLTDLSRLAEWSRDQGVNLISTLPLLSVFLDDNELFEPSPYSPASRLFFNELFLDPRTTDEYAACVPAQRAFTGVGFQRALEALRRKRTLVDYRAAADLHRRLLDPLAEHFFETNGDKSHPYRRFLRDNPRAEEYAAFRAACASQKRPWSEWPARMRRGTLRKSDYDPAEARYHLYAQYATERRLWKLRDDLEGNGQRLYLDLAVGCNPAGFDIWSNQSLYMTGSTVGSPPDGAFVGGQDWAFPPMHPQRAREQGYTDLIGSIRTCMRHAHALRLDHVMAYHRLFLIPEGQPALLGAYQGYHGDELFAILCLESHRNECRLIGENIGTVPLATGRALKRHRIGGLWIGQNAVRPGKKPVLEPIPANCAASLNTHDMPPLGAFLDGSDADVLVKIGRQTKAGARKDKAWRSKARKALVAFLIKHAGLERSEADSPEAIEHAYGVYLARSPAEVVLVNLEDMWGETARQNLPGTTTEHPNWRHKHAKSLEQITRSKELDILLRMRAKDRLHPPC